MSRITERFTVLRGQGRKALVPYITAGDPQPQVTVPLMHAMVAAGADILELGVPFSDPMADGPVIQKACERALAAGTSLLDVLAMVAEFRRKDQETPVILMGYLNPIEILGYRSFAEQAAAHGVDGLLTVDMPPEEAEPLAAVCKEQGLDRIFLLAPTSSPKRIEQISALGSGFIYYVSLKGVTGASTLDVDDVSQRVAKIRHYTTMPVGVGFGIRDARSAAQIASIADAAVVGSALVKRIEQYQNRPEVIPEEVSALLRTMREAIDATENV
ncbi:tryptophan synthase, alpha chain [Nitrosococcus oceani ATCC 19707]|uniref:Tryptophan synthase alpha chain n=2 Tax=Nitrosococcus oceani TaxID=1229 RepID=TRPA_NITOC|nr:tryptophan synthase subunit alpha [Nitrosococcus oceani]Q3JCB7.1 RecName: Full=Tryptophan synthase alpha chain [Nitrosococcus oceani ATCC 19707]KFI20029.1 tryptophan synthase alpha chain [Nitrosococcus oceani C-27]ABA57529.1 tryptophan synthase, alpha chain [Nitrosococcus oceani ATCC 19707]EDZ67017.1 tryptophan synthase, alpha subunit [Nitrosococcus oceani AFC27]GEM20681.1 tryptophan synthase subunit alpha [Nitrosococcus oceani]